MFQPLALLAGNIRGPVAQWQSASMALKRSWVQSPSGPYMISFEEFKKLDIRIGKILKAEPIAGADKLLRLEVDLGPEQRQLVAGIVQPYTPEVLIGRQIVVLANLEPRVLKGVESQGMLLAADDNGAPVLLAPDREVSPGSIVR